MFTIRKSADRGHFDHGWLDTYHTFSFADYYNPRFHNFRALRVINEDRVQPTHGFGTHAHRDMEIITYVLEGALEHKDNMGNGEVLRPGEVQRMTAGTGITHSEFNPSETQPVHLLQIWLMPERKGLEPSYEQRAFPESERLGRFRLVASHDGRDGSVVVHQDVELFAALLEAGNVLRHDFRPGRYGWLQVARGKVELNGQTLEAGDGVAISEESSLQVTANVPAEILLFDLE